jgi:hypothetical protein
MPYLVGDEFCASAFFNPKCCSSDSLLGSGGCGVWADPLEPECCDERDEQNGEEKSLKFHGEDRLDRYKI